jgi:Protein of unknown function (DUF3102)
MKKAAKTSGASSLEIVSANKPIALKDLSVPQLTEAFGGLDRLEKGYDNMSGICATLKGLVLIEVKVKLPHGSYGKWLEANFEQNKKTAERYCSLARAFIKSDSAVAFQTLTHDLASSVDELKKFQLNLSHPAVAQVSKWVAGRGAYQLMLDFEVTSGGSYDHTTRGKGHTAPLTQKERRELLRERCVDAGNAFMVANRLEAWRAVNEKELDYLIEQAEKLVAGAKKWRRLPKGARNQELMDELAEEYQAALTAEAKRKARKS